MSIVNKSDTIIEGKLTVGDSSDGAFPLYVNGAAAVKDNLIVYGDILNINTDNGANGYIRLNSDNGAKTFEITNTAAKAQINHPDVLIIKSDKTSFILNDGSDLGGFSSSGLTVTKDIDSAGRINANTGGASSVGILGKAIANGWAARYDSNNANFSGFYFDGNNDASMILRDDAGNSNVYLRSDSDSYFNGGNVGIGTSSPSENLTVSGDANVTQKFAVGVAAVHPTIDFYNQGTAYFNGSTTVDDNLIVTNGNVGIGNTNPQAKLDVEQSNSSSNTVFLSNSYNNKGIRLGNAGYGTISGFQDSNNTTSGTAYGLLIGLNTFYDGTNFSNDNQYVDPSSMLFKDGDIRFYTDDVNANGAFTPTERFVIDKTGDVGIGTDLFKADAGLNRVGIGTTNPETKLHVKQDSVSTFTGTAEHQFRVESDSTNNQYTGIGFAQGAGTDIAKIAMKRTSSGSHLYFGTSNNYGNGVTNSALVIDQEGYVGIGTTSPGQRLTVSTSDSGVGFTDGAFRFNAVSNYGGSRIILHHRQDANQVVLNEDGADLDFRVEGSSDVNLFKVDAGLNNIGIGTGSPGYKLDVNGTIRATGDVIAYSDERVKENIKTIENASEKVSKLRGVEFNKIGEDSKSIGVIAQEIEEVVPEVVKTDDEGMKAVAYGNLVALLIESNKELIKRVEKLENGITK